ncbi:rap guanine nucleotide exchange factor 4-like isoform X2 [Panonychus citri]|uniref:rap guanine nucleotide exchange factor 4-like isoform X2 n=1 Tax=Panonychus citri TaxID=50023 RepID=UPI0023074BFE|nr:rap guanine nucleotide exchange factor 4-like isoform X2 [Panonychus citri]XP_053204375.1 rap guanine nucleotide exchange factor 4-like isoform X2 [Panonychus citri]
MLTKRKAIYWVNGNNNVTSKDPKEVVTLCTLGVGTGFGESVLTGKPHSVSVITNEPCTLLRVRRDEFQEIWEGNSHLMADIVTPLVGLRCLKTASFNRSLSIQEETKATANSVLNPVYDNNSTNGTNNNVNNLNNTNNRKSNSTQKNNSLDNLSDRFKSTEWDGPIDLNLIGKIFHHLIITFDPNMIRDRKDNPSGIFHRNCLIGSELVDWMLRSSMVTLKHIHSRGQAATMFHVLLEAGILTSTTGEQQFWDKFIFYRFKVDCVDIDEGNSSGVDAESSWNGQHLDRELVDLLNDKKQRDIILGQCLDILDSLAPEANFRLIGSKRASDRTPEEVDFVYDELMHIKALSHLGNSVRKELASVIAYEKHSRKGTVLFNQGDPGKSWYIILKGTVNVVIVGKGVVCNLCEGDDFGKLALVNDAPRAATIVTNEDNCQFLRVDKDDFNRILRDVEANTVHLKEHGRDVLLLRKMVPKIIQSTGQSINKSVTNNNQQQSSNGHFASSVTHSKFVSRFLLSSLSPSPSPLPSASASVTVPVNHYSSHYKYMVLAGTPEKMLEHLLETRIDVTSSAREMVSNVFNKRPGNGNSTNTLTLENLSGVDTFLEDFILTHIIFLPVHLLCVYLLKHYRIDLLNTRQEKEFIIASKKRVIRFTKIWFTLISDALYIDDYVMSYLDELINLSKNDSPKFDNQLIEELTLLEGIQFERKRWQDAMSTRGIQKYKSDLPGPIRRMSTNGITDNLIGIGDDHNHQKNNRNHDDWNTINNHYQSIQPTDEIICRVYCADHTYTTLKMTIDSTARAVKMSAADKLGLNKSDGELILAEVKSSGERVLFSNKEVSIQTGLSVNGRIFVSLIDHIDALTPLPEQEGPKHDSFFSALDDVSSQDIACYLTYYSWILFQNVHEYEFIYHVFGRSNFGKITANLDLFLRLFNEIQYWVVTEIVLTTSVSKRVQILRKFIKVAGLCKNYQNLSIFFAITMGLSNIAVSRLTQTWDRLPAKLKRTFTQYESLIEPSRNHRKYRVYLSQLEAPIIPFTPLILKDMTFCHEGNKTHIDKSLINFEKMVMLSQSLQTFRFCRSKQMRFDSMVNGSVVINGNNNNHNKESNGSSDLINNYNPIVNNLSKGVNLFSGRKNSLVKIDQYIKDLKVIDNQRLLIHISHSLENKRT